MTAIAPEPVTADPPTLFRRTLLSQGWQHLTFLHWAVDPDLVAPLLPAGTVPDLHDGLTYVGLIAFRMHRIGWLGLPGVPYLGTFPETNVRLYSVDSKGQRGVVFRSLEASRLLPVLVARELFRLPYMWARMSVRTDGDTAEYESRRRWPKSEGAPACRLGVRIGERVEEPSELEHFLTARWRLHNVVLGRPMSLPNEHPRWPLFRAELTHCEEGLIAAAGLPEMVGPPVSVLYSPGVRVRFGRPLPA